MHLITEITILLLAAALAAPFGKLSRIGSVLAFVTVGLLIGPWVLGLISDADDILHFAEIGVVFLLFIIGLELQPRRLLALRKVIFGAGSIQLVCTALLIFAVLQLTELSWQSSLVISYGLALSSTAFALRLLADNHELASGQGKLGFGILLFQDLAIIPFLALLPLLAVAGSIPATEENDLPVWAALLIFCLFMLAGRYLLIPFLRLIAWSRVQEAFTATALLLVLGSALLMESIGLSMGLGAFLAGVLVADSEYRHQLEADIEPFKALLLGLFFMAVGMSTNISILGSSWAIILVSAALLIIVKMCVLALIGKFSGLDNRRAMRLAAYLCQGGEFGFVAFTVAGQYGILSAELKDQLIVIVTLSMALTPVVLKVVAVAFGKKTMSEAELSGLSLPASSGKDSEHPAVIIAGFGRFGQILGRVLNAEGIQYTAIDINPEQVKLVRQFGNSAFFGDLSHHSLLESAHVGKARLFALCIDDVEASIKITEQLKRHYPNLKIMARARNRHHEIRLRDLQIDYVIRETLLSSLEFTRQVLLGIGVDSERAHHMISTFTELDAKLLRQQTALVSDRASMIQSTQDAATEFRRLLQSESRVTSIKTDSSE